MGPVPAVVELIRIPLSSAGIGDSGNSALLKGSCMQPFYVMMEISLIFSLFLLVLKFRVIDSIRYRIRDILKKMVQNGKGKSGTMRTLMQFLICLCAYRTFFKHCQAFDFPWRTRKQMFQGLPYPQNHHTTYGKRLEIRLHSQ